MTKQGFGGQRHETWFRGDTDQGSVKTPVLFFVIVYVVILAFYFLINGILVKRLDRYSPAEIIKNRE